MLFNAFAPSHKGIRSCVQLKLEASISIINTCVIKAGEVITDS